MPFNAREQGLLGVGLVCAATSYYFFRQKRTRPFQIAYFLAWPTLGSAVILGFQPSEERMERAIQEHHLTTPDGASLEEVRQRSREQLAEIRRAAQEGREPGSLNKPWDR